MRITMKFTKMQAFGNDYVYIDAIHQNITNLPELALFVSDMTFAIGVGRYGLSVRLIREISGCGCLTRTVQKAKCVATHFVLSGNMSMTIN